MNEHVFRAALERLHTRMRLALGRGKVTLVDDSQAGVQHMQVDHGPTGPAGSLSLRDQTPRVTEFGFTSHPPVGSEVLTMAIAGDRSDMAVIGTNHPPSRLGNLGEGDSALYDVRGAFVWLSAAGLHVQAKGLPILIEGATTVTVKASQKVRAETPRFECTGDIIDNCDAQPVTVKQLRDAYDGHKHPGVQQGGSSTGTTDHPVP